MVALVLNDLRRPACEFLPSLIPVRVLVLHLDLVITLRSALACERQTAFLRVESALFLQNHRIIHNNIGKSDVYGDNRFIRIGKSLIVNKDYIAYINPTKQKLVLSDYSTFRHEVAPSRESLKALKEYLEKEESL